LKNLKQRGLSSSKKEKMDAEWNLFISDEVFDFLLLEMSIFCG
jgi:hypothetical protein